MVTSEARFRHRVTSPLRVGGFLFRYFQRCDSQWISCIGLSLLLGCLASTKSPEAKTVPALGNESVVSGNVLERSPIDSASLGIQPQQTLWHFKLLITKVEKVEHSDNFVKEGRIIEVYSNEVNAPKGTEKSVTVRISFRGDEMSGRYWIVGSVLRN